MGNDGGTKGLSTSHLLSHLIQSTRHSILLLHIVLFNTVLSLALIPSLATSMRWAPPRQEGDTPWKSLRQKLSGTDGIHPPHSLYDESPMRRGM
jgi:hypothetical protein